MEKAILNFSILPFDAVSLTLFCWSLNKFLNTSIKPNCFSLVVLKLDLLSIMESCLSGDSKPPALEFEIELRSRCGRI